MTDPNAERLAESLLRYVREHPQLRFWQALVSWARFARVLAERDGDPPEDTFYWHGKRGQHAADE